MIKKSQLRGEWLSCGLELPSRRIYERNIWESLKSDVKFVAKRKGLKLKSLILLSRLVKERISYEDPKSLMSLKYDLRFTAPISLHFFYDKIKVLLIVV